MWVSVYKTKVLYCYISADELYHLIMCSLQDLRPSGQARQGDELLKAAAELLEKHKDFTDKDNYTMAQGLLTR